MLWDATRQGIRNLEPSFLYDKIVIPPGVRYRTGIVRTVRVLTKTHGFLVQSNNLMRSHLIFYIYLSLSFSKEVWKIVRTSTTYVRMSVPTYLLPVVHNNIMTSATKE